MWKMNVKWCQTWECSLFLYHWWGWVGLKFKVEETKTTIHDSGGKKFLYDGQNSPPQRKQGNRVTRVHPGRSIWNLRVHHSKRKVIFQIITFRFYVGWSSGVYWAVHLLMGPRINPISLTIMEAEVTGVHGLTCEACSQLIRIPVNLAPQKGNKMISPGNLKKSDPRTPCPLGPIPFPYFRGFLWEWYWE